MIHVAARGSQKRRMDFWVRAVVTGRVSLPWFQVKAFPVLDIGAEGLSGNKDQSRRGRSFGEKRVESP
jgi:hypothetical protein